MRLQLNKRIDIPKILFFIGLVMFSYCLLLGLPAPTVASGLIPDPLTGSVEIVNDGPEANDSHGSNSSNLAGEELIVQEEARLLAQTKNTGEQTSLDTDTTKLGQRITNAVGTITDNHISKEDHNLTPETVKQIQETAIEVADSLTKGSDIKESVESLLTSPVLNDIPVADAIPDDLQAPIIAESDLVDRLLPETQNPEHGQLPMIPDVHLDIFPSSNLEDISVEHNIIRNHAKEAEQVTDANQKNSSEQQQQSLPDQPVLILQPTNTSRFPSSDGPVYGHTSSMIAIIGERVEPSPKAEHTYVQQQSVPADQWSQPPPYLPRLELFFSLITNSTR